MHLTGNLRQHPLVELLRSIEDEQKSGALILHRGRLRAALYFGGGQWLLGERVGASTVLAQELVRGGFITTEQFESVLGIPLREAGAVSDAQVLRALIGARLLTQDQLRSVVMDDAVALLQVLLGWRDGEFLFEEGVDLPQGRVALPLSIGALVSQSRPIPSDESVYLEQAPITLETVVDMVDISADSTAEIKLTRPQWRFLTAIDGQLPLWAICERLQAPPDAILRLTRELVTSGVLLPVGQIALPRA